MKSMKKRVYAGLLALLMVFSLIPVMEARAEATATVSITLPEGAENIVLDDENPAAYLPGAELVLSGVEGEVWDIGAYYVNEEWEGFGVWFVPTEEEGVYSSELMIDTDMEGTYYLQTVEIFLEDGDVIYLDENLPDSSITVVNNVTDKTAPEISNVQISASGETFVQGEGAVIEITAEITDEGLGLDEENLSVVIESVNGYIDESLLWINMEKQADGLYRATVYVDGLEGYYGQLYNSEWNIVEIQARDLVGNYTFYEGVDTYFYVVDSDGVCDTGRSNVVLNFYDENYDIIAEYVVDAEERMVTLEELLGEVPVYETELGFGGWLILGTDIVLQADTEFEVTYSGEWFDFYPVTENRYVEVDMCILNDEGYMEWTGYESYLISSGTTYAELLEMLPIPESVNGCAFVEWQIVFEDVELTDTVDMEILDVCAVYDKNLVTILLETLNENGLLTMKDTVLTVEHGMTYGKLLEMIEAPKSVMGCNFTGWTFFDTEISLDDIIEANAWVDVVAEYDAYPVTIERVYLDKDNMSVSDSKVEIYPAGTTIEELYDMWAVVTDDMSAEIITDWEASYYEDGEISLYNNTLQLTAVYENKNIITYTLFYIEDAGAYGKAIFDTIYTAFDADTLDEETITAYFEDVILSDLGVTHYEKLNFNEWNVAPIDMDDDGVFDAAYAEPAYDIVTPLVYAYAEEGIYVYAAEAGAEISLPTEDAGYYITWQNNMGEEIIGSYTVPEEAEAGEVYYLYAVRGEAVPDDEPVTPDEPTEPEVPDDEPVTPDEPTEPEVPDDEPVTPDEPTEPEVPDDEPVTPDEPTEPEVPDDEPVTPDEPTEPEVPDNGDTTPETSDNMNIALYAVLLAIGVGITAVAFKKRQLI